MKHVFKGKVIKEELRLHEEDIFNPFGCNGYFYELKTVEEIEKWKTFYTDERMEFPLKKGDEFKISERKGTIERVEFQPRNQKVVYYTDVELERKKVSEDEQKFMEEKMSLKNKVQQVDREREEIRRHFDFLDRQREKRSWLERLKSKF